jgi:alanyl-tRNA synthetase
MDSPSIRQAFLDFFAEKGHAIVPSAPIVNKDDPTLLFVNSGMNAFKDIFTGNKPAKHRRVADTQKCLRVSGKHNDLEEVGHDTYHHTMFEMLGNWSFGDYFRTEAIDWAWEFLVDRLKIDAKLLYVTVFGGDEPLNLPADEASFQQWTKHLPAERILRFGKRDNFWEMGDVGPCGPCTEVHIDLRSDEERAQRPGAEMVNLGHPQVVEIWNLVLMQFSRKQDGTLETLKMQSVDTGMGFERLCMVMQGKQSNYDTDVFRPLLQYLTDNHQCQYGRSEWESIAMRVVVDHLRAVCFTIADGQLPSNTGAGYVIRRLIRRASRYAFKYLSIHQPFMFQMAGTLVDQLGEQFPELKQQYHCIRQTLEQEERSFLQKLARGSQMFDDYVKVNTDSSVIDGQFAFELYDTFGFPLDLTATMAREIGRELDQEGFDQHMQAQRQRSKKAAEVQTGDWVSLADDALTTFVGYEHTTCLTKIKQYRTVASKKGTAYHIVLETTPFYAESGGQIGDTGTLSRGEVVIEVLDTFKENQTIIHLCDKLPDEPEGEWLGVVYSQRRRKIKANHSATHLLQAALRQVLGHHVEQRGSLVTDEGLRFDFQHFQKMTDEELSTVEQLVNQKIVDAIPLVEYKHLPIQEAKAMGAMALFGEKYDDFVRVIQFDKNYSTELCGGIHVHNTVEIRYFKIVSEGSISAGIRRLEAVTSDTAIAIIQQCHLENQRIKSLLKINTNLERYVIDMVAKQKELETKMQSLRNHAVINLRDQLIEQVRPAGQHQVLVAAVELESGDELKTLAFELRKILQATIIVLGSVIDEKPQMCVMLTEDIQDQAWDAKIMVNEWAKLFKGGGGGQKFYATAGGKDAEGLSAALEAARNQLFAGIVAP